MKLVTRKDYKKRRHLRIRKRISGTADRPRVAICVTNKHIYVQFIDDVTARTLLSGSTLKYKLPCNISGATELGKKLSEEALKAGITRVVIDRGGHKFHGKVKAIVDELVKGGVKISRSEPEGNL